MSAQHQPLHRHHHPTREPRPAATRTELPPDMQHNNTSTAQQTLSAPASQESFISVQSSAGSSNLSQITTSTDLTSPSSTVDHKYDPVNTASQDASQRPMTTQQIYRNRTPENAQNATNTSAESALYSPMSITSPAATNGAKRTASGHVKNAHSITTSPYIGQVPGRDSRRESLSSSGSKAGEIAATLKTRLGYAMAKVQNGWEHKSLNEVEQLAAERTRSNRNSISHLDQRPGTNGLSNGASKLSMHDHNYGRGNLDVTAPPPSKRHSGNYAHYTYPSQQMYANYGQSPHLQPAAEFGPTSSSRVAYSIPNNPPLQRFGNGMSPPRTPVTDVHPQRPATIRTETQTAEAERDALQALFQLGSPHTSVVNQMPRSATATSSSQERASPHTADATPRHVTFARSESASTSSSGVAETRTRLIERIEEQ